MQNLSRHAEGGIEKRERPFSFSAADGLSRRSRGRRSLSRSTRGQGLLSNKPPLLLLLADLWRLTISNHAHEAPTPINADFYCSLGVIMYFQYLNTLHLSKLLLLLLMQT
jgi:hypothetical protein